MKALFRIAVVAARELLSERIFYVLAAFAAAAFVASGLLGQVTYADQGRITLDFLLGGQHLALAMLAIFVSISLFQRELLSGSVAMVLSKPVSRTTFLLGKFLGQLTVQTALAVVLGIFAWLFCSYLEYAPAGAIAQATAMAALEAAVLAAAAYFFAVNAGSLTAGIGALGVFLAGHLRPPTKEPTEFVDAMFRQVLRGFFPDLEIFNVRLLASYGETLPWTDFGYAALYGALAIAFFLFAACLCFERRDVIA